MSGVSDGSDQVSTESPRFPEGVKVIAYQNPSENETFVKETLDDDSIRITSRINFSGVPGYSERFFQAVWRSDDNGNTTYPHGEPDVCRSATREGDWADVTQSVRNGNEWHIRSLNEIRRMEAQLPGPTSAERPLVIGGTQESPSVYRQPAEEDAAEEDSDMWLTEPEIDDSSVDTDQMTPEGDLGGSDSGIGGVDMDLGGDPLGGDYLGADQQTVDMDFGGDPLEAGATNLIVAAMDLGGDPLADEKMGDLMNLDTESPGGDPAQEDADSWDAGAEPGDFGPDGL